MSKSNKARYGMRCKHWKDSVFASRSQAHAHSKRKQIKQQRARTNDKSELRDLIGGKS
jgi:hypothetical protein